MNVRDLIEQLQSCDPEMEVRIDTPTGDFWRSHTAARVDYVDEIECPWTEYHRTYAIPSDGDTPTPDAVRPNKTFVVIG
jgi:hypothetical protein